MPCFVSAAFWREAPKRSSVFFSRARFSLIERTPTASTTHGRRRSDHWISSPPLYMNSVKEKDGRDDLERNPVTGKQESFTTTIASDTRKDTTTSTATSLFPWTDFQTYALMDHIKDYSFHNIILWRNMIQNVPELTGYPPSFVQEQYETIVLRKNSSSTTTASNTTSVNFVKSNAVLPYLDEYSFEPQGGIQGRIYGLPGIADGSFIQTSEVQSPQDTLPYNYVVLKDKSTFYELGKPLRLDDDETRQRAVSVSGGSLSRIANPLEGEEPILDADLVRLASLTSIVVGGALAFETLSHHLTVNVFWV